MNTKFYDITPAGKDAGHYVNQICNGHSKPIGRFTNLETAERVREQLMREEVERE